ncbi:uncharacterized protein TNCV_2629411 [Trichonephila clavipes]|uniref:Transposase n=1 Tax=Trichonephila clavipes TaxID=2585209 RepID=A0A8X6SA72_TRICX|nr:uncharacterized protein TNCV_2629411 [Trichonephila clavipes]
MITNFFIPELNNHDVQELRFQQDGAACHTARATLDLLKDTFGDRLISRFGPVNWPPRSCDLTPLDNFLWGYVNSIVKKATEISQFVESPCTGKLLGWQVGYAQHNITPSTNGRSRYQMPEEIATKPIFDSFFQWVAPPFLEAP